MRIEEIIKEFSKKDLTHNEITMLLLRSTKLFKNGLIHVDQLKKVTNLYDKRNKEINVLIEKKENEELEYKNWEKNILSLLKIFFIIVLGLIILYLILTPNSQNIIDFDDSFKPETQTR